MATIDRAQLLADTKLWLPSTNILSDAQITIINESVITSVGDDDTKYGEVLCKSLLACANVNEALYSVDSGNITRERVGNVELYFDSKEDIWQDYIQNLPQICILYGYELANTVGMYISTGNPTQKGPAVTPIEKCIAEAIAFFEIVNTVPVEP